MKLRLTRAACLLPLVLNGCALLHRHHAEVRPVPNIPPPVDETPADQRESAQAKPPAPPAPVPDSEPEKTTHADDDEDTKPTPKRKKPAPKPAQTGATPGNATPPANQQAGTGSPEAVSAIGQLSTGGPGDSRDQTMRSLDNTERSLKDIHRKLNAQEQKTAEQIREYIKQAKAALTSNDLDGAQTLATKAKLLLGELIQ